MLDLDRSIKSDDYPAAEGKNSLRWLWLSVVIVIFDQLTKYIASTGLHLYEPVPVLPVFNLTLMHNTGAAFSFLNQASGWQRWLFIVLAVVVSGVLIGWLKQLPLERGWLACALALILGGAIGNLWDRVVLGYVVDFIEVYYQRWHFPAFNLADAAISVGAGMFVIDSLRNKTEF